LSKNFRKGTGKGSLLLSCSKKPIGIFLFALKTDFQKSEENVEKRRKPETISGFLFGIFFVKTHWRRHPEVRPPLRFDGGFGSGIKVLQTSALPLKEVVKNA